MNPEEGLRTISTVSGSYGVLATTTRRSIVPVEDTRQDVLRILSAEVAERMSTTRYTELAHQLLGIKVTPRQRELFVTEFIPMPPTGLVTDRVARTSRKPARPSG